MLTEEAEFSYEVREACAEDWKPAMNMVWKTFLKFEGKDYSPVGIRNFWDFITDKDLYQAFLNGVYRAWVVVDGKKIIGFASLRNINLLSLLFVDEKYHRQGVGSALVQCLCAYLQQEVGQDHMLVKAAPYALEFYKKLGFQAMGPEEQYSGIRVTAMKKSF